MDREVLNKRLEWYYNEMDNHGGQPPSVRDITKHFKKNGDKPEWEVYWNAIVRNARKLAELDIVEDIRQIVKSILYYREEE